MIRSIRMLHHFLAASRASNLHRAAKTVSVTQSALSKSLSQLEADLGVQLFERSVRGVTLTKYGESLYARAVRVEAECALIDRELSEMSTGHAGSLTIGAGAAWISVLLPGILVALQRSRPSAHFTVLRSSGPQFAQDFANGEIDLGLGSIDAIAQNTDEYICEPLSTIETRFLAGSRHPLHARAQVSFADFSEYSWAMLRQDVELTKRLNVMFASKRLPAPTVAVSAESVTTVLEAVRLSQMISCLPAPLIPLAETFDVHPLPIDTSPWTFQSGVIYQKASIGYPLLTDLLTALHEKFGDISSH